LLFGNNGLNKALIVLNKYRIQMLASVFGILA